jgi:threonine/homoserine/homoserine lactone efflux protein
MAELLARLVLLGLAGAVSPIAIVVCIALLSSRRPLVNAVAYVAGITTVLAAVGAFALAVFGPGSASDAESSEIVNTIELTLGVLLLLFAAKQALGEADPDAPPPGWMAMLERLGPARAYAFGLIVEATNIKRLAIYLAGLSEITRSDVTVFQSVLSLVIFGLLLEAGLIAPVIVYATIPGRSTAILDDARRWLLTYNSRILAVIFGLIGAVLVERGLSGLL